MSKERLIMLGTGCAMVTECYNTCFVIQNAEGDCFLTDAGGGNGILRQMKAARIAYPRLHHLFVTHGHTDHILGVVWVIRRVAMYMLAGSYEGDFHIYCHDEAAYMLRVICDLTLTGKHKAKIDNGIYIHEIKDGTRFSVLGMDIQAFDILSAKAKQFGYSLQLPDGKKLTCLGDEPFNEHSRIYAAHSDWLLAEAFCLYRDRTQFKPYEKHHSTVKEACETAAALQCRNLVLYHTEDTDLAERKVQYTAEGTLYYDGGLYVPDDLDVIELS